MFWSYNALVQPIRRLHRHGEWGRVKRPQLVSCWPLIAVRRPFVWAQQNYTMDGFQNDVFSSFTGHFNFLYGLPKQMLTCGISHTGVVDESHDQCTKLKKTSITVRGKASIRCLMCACVSKCDYVCVFMAYKVHVCLSVTMCVCSWHIRCMCV